MNLKSNTHEGYSNTSDLSIKLNIRESNESVALSETLKILEIVSNYKQEYLVSWFRTQDFHKQTVLKQLQKTFYQ